MGIELPRPPLAVLNLMIRLSKSTSPYLSCRTLSSRAPVISIVCQKQRFNGDSFRTASRHRRD